MSLIGGRAWRDGYVKAYPLPVIPGAVRTEKVGSRATCRPAPTNTDEDWLVLASHDQVDEAARLLTKSGWTLGGSDPNRFDPSTRCPGPDDRFSSFTKGEVNIILTASEKFFDRFMLATHVATRLNLLHKLHRITLFQAILYGNKV